MMNLWRQVSGGWRKKSWCGFLFKIVFLHLVIIKKWALRFEPYPLDIDWKMTNIILFSLKRAWILYDCLHRSINFQAKIMFFKSIESGHFGLSLTHWILTEKWRKSYFFSLKRAWILYDCLHRSIDFQAKITFFISIESGHFGLSLTHWILTKKWLISYFFAEKEHEFMYDIFHCSINFQVIFFSSKENGHFSLSLTHWILTEKWRKTYLFF